MLFLLDAFLADWHALFWSHPESGATVRYDAVDVVGRPQWNSGKDDGSIYVFMFFLHLVKICGEFYPVP